MHIGADACIAPLVCTKALGILRTHSFKKYTSFDSYAYTAVRRMHSFEHPLSL